MEKVLELKQKRAKLVQEARNLIEVAEKENRSLDEEQYNKIEADIDNLGKQIEREERLLGIESQLEQRMEVTKPNPKEVADQEKEERSNAFWKMIRLSRNALDANEVRALNIATDAEGGYTVPDEFQRMLIEALEDRNVMRSLATVIRTSSGERQIPVVTDYGDAAWTGEAQSFHESDITFDQVTLNAYKITTLIRVSEELLHDSAFNLAAFIADKFGDRVGNKEEEAFITGDGNNKPTGLVGSAQVGHTAGSASAITGDDLIDLFHSLKRPYRQRATWLLNDSTVKAVRKLKDDNGQYIWQPGLQAGQPDRILTRPVEVSEHVPELGTGNKPIVFGDISKYWIADRQNIAVQRLNELYSTTGQVGFRTFKRTDGKLTLPEAVKVMQMA